MMKGLSIAVPVAPDFKANFLLYQSANPSKCRFYVSVVDWEGRAHFFFMNWLQNCWKIKTNTKLPQWIIDLEEEFNELIFYKMDLEKWEAK